MFKYFSLQIIKPTNLPQTQANKTTVTDALNIVFSIVGALAFLIIVIAGLRYILAQGDPNKVAESRRMILYALVGLLVVAFAAAIVNFVIGRTS
jgi:NADH:ubiquinone oxidoreductase subunit 2 (subunit N)